MELNIRNDSDRIQNVPIQCKMTLTMPNCPFVLYIGTRKLAKRVEFEQYIRDIRGKIAI